VDLQARRRIFESWPKKRTLKVGSWVEQVYQSPGYDWWNQLRPHLSGDFSNSVNVLYVSFIIYIYISLSLSLSFFFFPSKQKFSFYASVPLSPAEWWFQFGRPMTMNPNQLPRWPKKKGGDFKRETICKRWISNGVYMCVLCFIFF
jgi:hypothetical protein